MNESTNTEREALMELIDVYAEARHVGGCHTYNAKTAKARVEMIAALDAAASPYAPCYVCGRPMDGLSEDDCHCFHRKELRASLAAKPLPAAVPVEWPTNAAEIREFIGSHMDQVRYHRSDAQPHEDDKYQLSAHDLLSAFRWWAEFAAPQPAVAAGWQPIETAPTDGTPLLLRSKKGRIADGAWITATSNCGGWAWAYVNLEPVEWRPMPAGSDAVCVLRSALNAMDEDEWSKPIFNKARNALATTLPPAPIAGESNGK